MKRGKLRIYLGAAPGVGKTVAMLGEGRRRAERGADVVIGLVETHGRRLTTQATEGLEVVPRRTIEYRGATFTDLDVDAVLARRPAVALVDELAHANPTGSERSRRYEDIEVLLQAGIDVISTVNIQHLESLNDAVFAITGVRQRETVPDDFVRSADQIELVDMSPESLRRRMAHGNVYPAQKVDAALASYFRPGNLAALRELSLLWLADRVDEGLARYRAEHRIEATWPTRERVVVALRGGPESEAVLRRGARIASRGAGGELFTVFVSSADGLTGADATALARFRSLTSELGGSFHQVNDDNPAEAILKFARRVNASQIVLGASTRSRWSLIWTPGVIDAVVSGSGDIDVLLVTHTQARESRPRRAKAALTLRRRQIGWALAVAAPALLTVILDANRTRFGLPLEVLLYLAVAVAVALVGGFGPALGAAVLGAMLLNWFFAPPLYTLTIADPQNIVVLAVYLVVSTSVASTVHVSARRAEAAQSAEKEAATLTALTHAMLSSTAPLPLLLKQCRDWFDMEGAAIVRVATPQEPARIMASDGTFTSHDIDTAATKEDIDDDTMLVLRGPALGANEQALLTAYAAIASAVLTRQRLKEEEAATTSLAQDNRARQALLSAVSHDLRTPLAAVKAAVTSLRSEEIEWGPDDEAELLEAIEESTDRLDTLVGNLLDLSRLHTGTMTPMCIRVDAVDAVRNTIAGIAAAHRVALWFEGTCPAYMDPGLFDRVLANLVENALRYAPQGSQVVVNVAVVGDRTQVRVIDTGPGVPRAAQDKMFAPFQRHGDAPDGDGLGLGLAVARGLAEAMGATVTADDTPGGGLTMTIDLPSTAPSSATEAQP